MTTRSASTSRLIRAGAALLLLLATLAACGADPTATPVPQPTPTPEPEPTATPKPAASDGMAPGGWRTDVAVGSNHGARAFDSSIALPDGSTATLESAAGGRAVLLYFFATW
ncbi:MAG: hypothetical protein F4X54_08905 [Chloroflexi bacterium]|nr:hypothetical protein [Chloroflexota bacterium]MYB84838.1 hypothetical protein [Chloroflexota bacterium]